MVKNHLPVMQETWVPSLGQEDPLEENLATHSSILAWRIPIDRGAWWAYSPWGGNELDTTEQLNNNRHTFLTETLKILEIDEKILSLNKARQTNKKPRL